MSGVLDDKALREAFHKIEKEYISRLDDNVIDDGKPAWVWYRDAQVKLLKEQQRAYAKGVADKAVHDFCQDISVKVSNSFNTTHPESGGLAMPWEQVVRPIIYKRLADTERK